MTAKLFVLTVLVTLTLWLGGIFGCSNQKMDDQPQPNDTQAQADTPEQEPPSVLTASARIGAKLPPALDRSDWPRHQAGGQASPTVHYPVYFIDLNLDKHDEVDALFEGSMEMRLANAMAGADDGPYLQKLGHGFVQYGGFGYDFVLLPVRKIQQWPFQKVTSPGDGAQHPPLFGIE